MKSKEMTLQLIAKAKAAIASELSSGAVTAPETALRAAATALAKMETAVSSGLVPPRGARDGGLGRMVVDGWPLGSALGTLILEAEDAYLSLP